MSKSGFRLSALSRRRLNGVHPDLVRVIERAILDTPVDFRVQEGVRTKERQAQLYKAGATKTLNSRHLTGHAIDLVALVGGVPRWDWPLYDRIGEAVKRAAKAVGVPIVWGGDWRTFKDGPHFELDRRSYP
jgi:peptidoglycan L-alanyl-D-glutamate endopeptidase CwlK